MTRMANVKRMAAGVAVWTVMAGTVTALAQQAAPKSDAPAATPAPAPSGDAKVEAAKVASNLVVKALDFEAKSMTVAAQAADGTTSGEEQVFQWGDSLKVSKCVGQETKKASLAELKAGAIVTVRYTGGKANLAQEVTLQAAARAPKATGTWMPTGTKVHFGGGGVQLEGPNGP